MEGRFGKGAAMSDSFTTEGVEEVLIDQLLRDLGDVPPITKKRIPPEEVRASIEPGPLGGATRFPATRDHVLLMHWLLLSHYFQKAHHLIAVYPNNFIRLFEYDKVFGSWGAAKQQVYRRLGLNGHRIPGPQTFGLNFDPGDDDMPGNCVPRQRSKPR
jgi:hypothetical protein